MTRPHDMGGRFGDGSVHPEPQGIPTLEEWQWRALALTIAAGSLGQWNIDVSRHARECLSPKDYARFSYFEKWSSGLADLLGQAGVLSSKDLKGLGGDEKHPLSERKLMAENVRAALAKGGPADRDSDVDILFEPGASVRTNHPGGNRRVDGGHTRLPSYAVGAVGRIVRLHGQHVLPDSNAHGLGEAPEPLYAVAFAASELWANPEHPRDEVVLDLWQSYLAPA
ncbi:MAG: nitrile hydratase subunit beta [Paracoccaceae bacterium]